MRPIRPTADRDDFLMQRLESVSSVLPDTV